MNSNLEKDVCKAGFTILESLVALAFLALASLAVISTFVFSSRLDTRREGHQQAALLALDSLEEARALLASDFSHDLTLPKAPSQNPAFQLERRQELAGEEFGLEPDALKLVTVVVTWGPDSQPQSYRLEERFMESTR